MSINNNYINEIHRMHVEKQLYVLNDRGEIKQTSVKKCTNPLLTAEKLLALATDSSKNTEEKRLLQACAYDYLRLVQKLGVVKTEEQDLYVDLLAKAFILVMGKELSPSLIGVIKNEFNNKGDWLQFILNNHIHYLVQRQQIHFHKDPNPCPWICIQNHWLQWSQLQKIETENGFQFLCDGREAFVTDKNLKLKNYFYAGDQGVTKGDPIDIKEIKHFFHRPPSGKCWLSVYVTAKDEIKIQFGQSHAFLALEDKQGNFFTAGQFGLKKEFSIWEKISPFGTKQVGVATPDKYSSVPAAQHLIKETRIEITQQEYDTIYTSIQQDKENGTEGSLIKGNCASYVQKKLNLIGIQAKAQMTFQAFLCRLMLQVFPKAIKNLVVKWSNALPETVKKVAHFNPFIYPIGILASCVVKLLSGNRKSDFSVIDAVFRPWRVKVSHPLSIYEWLDELKKEQENYSIFTAQVTDKTPLGREVLAATKKMGFQSDSEGRIKLNQAVHITQHAVKPLILMIIESLYQAVIHKFKQWSSRRKNSEINTTLLFLHSLMNQKFITPYQFNHLKEMVDDASKFTREVKAIVDNLHQRDLVDRRSYIHLCTLLKKHKTHEVLTYITSLSLIHGLNTAQHQNAMRELITSKVQIEITTHLSNYQKNYFFSPEAIKTIHEFSAQVLTYEWALTIKDTESKKEIIEAIRNQDEKHFSSAMAFYFSKQSELLSLNSVEFKIFKEMENAVAYLKGENAFVNFAQIIQTQSRIDEVEKQIQSLRSLIENNFSAIGQDGINDLKRLHQNLGLLFGADIGYAGSPTFLSDRYGKMRVHWQRIDDLLNRSTIPAASEVDVWPDIGLREIQPAVNIHKPPIQSSDKKRKVFFAYCSWGNGHKSVTDSLLKSLGEKYRVASCDIPDEVLIERDPVFNLLGSQHSVTTLYNTMVAGNHWGVINLLKKMSAKPTPDEEIQSQKDLIRRKLLQERPDMVVATYERHSHLLLQVAEELGIPFIQVYTDMLSPVSDTLKEAWKTNYPHKKMLAPYPLPEMIAYLDKATSSQKDYAFFGYPIRCEFLQQMDKQALRSKYGVKKGQKVVLCMNGGVGGSSPWPETISKAKKGALGHPVKVIVVCGKNQTLYNKMKRLKSKDPNIEIDVRGFTSAQTMAEISEIADVTVTKPGGATIAENLAKGNYLLLDTQHSQSLPWEMEAAKALSLRKLAQEIGGKKDFIDQLKQALLTTVPKCSEFDQLQGKTELIFKSQIDQMMDAIEHDTSILPKKLNVHSQLDVQFDAPEVQDLEQSLTSFLKLNEAHNPQEIIPSLKRAIWEATQDGKWISFNLESSRFGVVDKFEFQSFSYALDVILKELKNSRPFPTEALTDILRLARQFQKTDKKMIAPLIKKLETVDYYRVSKLLLEKESSDPTSLDSIDQIFLIPQAAKKLKDWANLLTSRSRRNPNRYPNEHMLKEKDLIDVFLHHPEELDFIFDLSVHRRASAFNHSLSVVNHHLNILYEGQPTPVSTLIPFLKLLNGRIFSIKGEKEYTYTYNKGLSVIAKGQHPILWEDSIPLFKQKQRKSNDYRLEVISVVGKQNHGWVRLKDPSGNVYSNGKFWDTDYQLDTYQILSSIPGYVRAAGDLQEFLGQEKNWKRTRIVLNQGQFDRLKRKIIQQQKKEKNYNLANNNCVSFVRKLLKEIGISEKINVNALILFSMPHSIKKILIRHQSMRHTVEVATYPLRILQNVILGTLGMWKKRDLSPNANVGFSNTWDFVSWEKGMIDHPSQLRLLQEILEAEHGNKLDISQWKAKAKTHVVAAASGAI